MYNSFIILSVVQMDFFPDHQALSLWLVHYGGFALFTLLALEIIALPIPGEPLMLMAGVLMDNGDLHIPTTVMAAYAGAISGIHLSYLFGRTAGHNILTKYGSYIGITERKLAKAHNWFGRFGKWTLFIGYYIPGVRHLTGFLSGASNLEYRTFAIFAICGAFIWVSIFLSAGYFFSQYFISIYELIASM